MAKLIFIAFVLFSSINAQSQIIAHTNDGRRVILNKDGTWEFAAEQPNKVEELKIPAKRKFLHPQFSRDINAEYYYQQEYDEFENKTRTAVGVKVRDGLYMRFYYYSPGLTLKTVPLNLVMMFASAATSTQFPEGTNLKLALDGERIELGKFDRMSRITPAGLREFIYREIPLNTLLKLISSDYVAGKLFNTDFVLKQEQLEALRDFTSRMK